MIGIVLHAGIAWQSGSFGPVHAVVDVGSFGTTYFEWSMQKPTRVHRVRLDEVAHESTSNHHS